MNTKGVNEVAEFLLYGYLCDSMPGWKKLPRAVKHMLMKKLGEKHGKLRLQSWRRKGAGGV